MLPKMSDYNILGEAKRMATKANLGVPFTIYNGEGKYQLDPSTPHVFITLDKIPDQELPCDKEHYSFLDFVVDAKRRMIHSPQISLRKNHQCTGLFKKLNRLMEDFGRKLEIETIRAVNVTNPKLKKYMIVKGGYVEKPDDGFLGPYLEKRLE